MGTKAKAMNRGCGGRCIISARELETIVVGFLFFFSFSNGLQEGEGIRGG